MSSSSKSQLEPAAPAETEPVHNSPPELELGEVAVVIDQDGLIIAAEDICTALFRWEPAELVGQPLESLLLAGTDKIRQQLEPGRPAAENGTSHRLFALAQRKDGVSFPVGVSLQVFPPDSGCWWALTFHDVNSAPVAHRELSAVGLPPVPAQRSRAQVAAPPGLANIPDIFQRAPAESAGRSELPAPPAVAAPEAALPAAGRQLSPVAPAPAVPAAEPVDADATARLHELEQTLKQTNKDLKRTRVHLQQQDEQLHAAHNAAQNATAALEAQTARCAQLEEELTRARQASEELTSQLSVQEQSRAESEARLQELEQRLAQTPPPAPPAPAPVEDDPSMQELLLEAESRLRTAVTSLARATAELESERGERRRSDQRAASLAARMQQLHEELKNHLESEQLDRQRLSQLEQQLHEQTQQHDLTVAKLQSSLQLEQCERKRVESELVRSRMSPADSGRNGRSLANGLRRQLRPAAESLHQSACRLLRAELSEEQKQLVQTMLENTLLLQTSLHESPES